MSAFTTMNSLDLHSSPTQMFSKLCKIFKNNYFIVHLWTTASDRCFVEQLFWKAWNLESQENTCDRDLFLNNAEVGIYDCTKIGLDCIFLRLNLA